LGFHWEISHYGYNSKIVFDRQAIPEGDLEIAEKELSSSIEFRLNRCWIFFFFFKQQPTIIISSTGEGKARRKVVHMFLFSNKNVALDKTENAWVPTIATKRAENQMATDTDVVATLETNNSVQAILNKIVPESIDVMIKSFMALPINTVDLVFEKIIDYNIMRKKYDYIFDLDET